MFRVLIFTGFNFASVELPQILIIALSKFILLVPPESRVTHCSSCLERIFCSCRSSYLPAGTKHLSCLAHQSTFHPALRAYVYKR